jgi:hypothetical protein
MLTRIDPARISLGLAAVLVAAPFLFAEHRPPMPSFYDEWLGVTLAVLAVVAFLPRWRASIAAVPELALWLCAFAAWLAIQALLREPAYPQLAFAGIAYALLAAQLAWLGRSLAERFGTERVVDILATAILAGALANAAIGIVQHHGVPRVLAGLIGTAAGPRIVGHVGQPNILADYLALGQAALLYLLVRGRIRAAFWWAAAALLILASSYTQSRGAILFSLWICALACVFWRRGPAWQRLALHAAILALATLALMSLERVTAAARDPRLALSVRHGSGSDGENSPERPSPQGFPRSLPPTVRFGRARTT